MALLGSVTQRAALRRRTQRWISSTVPNRLEHHYDGAAKLLEMPSESVLGLARNGCSGSVGISARLGPLYAQERVWRATAPIHGMDSPDIATTRVSPAFWNSPARATAARLREDHHAVAAREVHALDLRLARGSVRIRVQDRLVRTLCIDSRVLRKGRSCQE